MAKSDLNYPVNLEDKLGFQKIRELLIQVCQAELAKEYARSFSVSNDLELIRQQLAETREFTELLEFENSFDLATPNDLRKELKRATVPGTYLPLESFLDIRNNYKAVSGVLRFFEKTKEELYPRLRDIVRDIKVFPFVLEKIDRVFNKQGVVKDSASKELSSIRASMVNKTQGVSKKMQSIVDRARKEGWIDQDTSASMREGRLVVPLPATHKRRINGLVHDESASGKTVYVEPVELIELNNEIRELEIAERREIIKILIDLTADIRPYFDEILTWPELIGQLDFIRAKAKLSKRWEGVWLELSEDKTLEWKSVRHPLLVLSYKSLKKKVVAQDIELNPTNRILLISGPNAGGKSVCLKTVGLVQYMIQCGILPPVAEGSVSPVFKEMFIDIGDDQSLENDLSTYSSHLHSMNHFVKHAGDSTLLLIDEFGTGTEPQLGAAMAQAILEELNKTGAFGVITTHYSNLKHFAASTDGIVNGAMLYDAQNLKPLFRLEIGKPGSSFAFEIAQQIGLSQDILNKAKEQVGSDYIQFDKHLREISRDKRYWERKRSKIRQQEKNLDLLLTKYEEQVKTFDKEKKKKSKEFQAEAEKMLGQINKKIENTIQEIRQSQAEKEKTRQNRKKLENFSSNTQREINEQVDEGDANLKKIKQEHDKLRSRYVKDSEERSGKEEEQKPLVSRLVPGIKVRLSDSDTTGEVLKVNKKTALVTVGEVMTTIAHDQLEVISDQEFNQSNKKANSEQFHSSWRQIEERRLNFSPNIDLRGARAEEAVRQIQELLDQAIMFEERHLRILHGKGNGVLREVIRQYLSTNDLVSTYKDEDIRFGGSGITLVELAW